MESELVVLDGSADRRLFIGGSDVAAILGLAPEIDGKRKTALDVYLSKTRPDTEPPEELPPLKRRWLDRRRRWEPVVVSMLKEEMEAEIVHINRRLFHPSCPWQASEIDAEARDGGEMINVEIKTVSPRAYGQRFGWGEPGTEDCPINYWLQVQHSLSVTGRKRAVVVAMVGIDDFLLYPIQRAEKDISDMRAALAKFWHENVLKRVPPEPMTLADLSKLFPRQDADLEVPGHGDLGSKALQLRALTGQIAAWELQAQSLEFDIKRAMGKAEALVVDGNKIFTWKEENWSRLDQARLKEEEKAIHKKYTKSGKHRVLRALSSWSKGKN